MSTLYQKRYAYLVGQVHAITQYTEDLRAAQEFDLERLKRIADMLHNALQTAEDMDTDAREDRKA